jgi:Mg-chelatase subunit ChlD
MDRPNRGGGRKIDSALAAAASFIARLDLTPDAAGRSDRVAIVGFNDAAWTASTLGADAAAANAALDALPARMAQGTRLDLALDEGRASLAVPRDRNANPIVILLTDGLPNRVPTPEGGGSQEDRVAAVADAVKATGARIFTIGLGDEGDVLRDLLQRVASAPGDAYLAPDGEDLAAIYRQIAGRLSECP